MTKKCQRILHFDANGVPIDLQNVDEKVLITRYCCELASVRYCKKCELCAYGRELARRGGEKKTK